MFPMLGVQIKTFDFVFCFVFFEETGIVVLACRSELGLEAAQRACQEMSENLQRVTQDKQSFDLRTAAELDDLYRTKINLEERLIELIRYKHT